MDNIKSLNKYLKYNFPELIFGKSLFYNCKIGIRFEIGSPSIDYSDDKYIKFAYLRSIMLFEQLFYPDTEVYFVVDSHRWIEDIEGENQVKDTLRKYLSEERIYGEVKVAKLPYICQDKEKELLSTFRYCLSCKVKDLDCRQLLKAMINQDLGIKPSFNDDVFFINKSSCIIYHLYDDRGLDIVSNRKSALEKIYEKYNQWILDYDRKIIEQIFK